MFAAASAFELTGRTADENLYQEPEPDYLIFAGA